MITHIRTTVRIVRANGRGGYRDKKKRALRASGRRVFQAAGTGTLKLKLTAAGNRAVRKTSASRSRSRPGSNRSPGCP